MEDPQHHLPESLRRHVDGILAPHIPDPADRDRAAAIITAQLRVACVRVLRQAFDPYLDPDTPIDHGTAAELMRRTVLIVAGYRALDDTPPPRADQMSEPSPTIGAEHQ